MKTQSFVYECDLLRKPITKDQVFKEIGKNIISKEAVAQLPECFKQYLQQLVSLFRGKKDTTIQSLTSEIVLLIGGNFWMPPKPFQSIEEAEQFIYDRDSVEDCSIFQNGELVKKLKVKTVTSKFLVDCNSPREQLLKLADRHIQFGQDIKKLLQEETK